MLTKREAAIITMYTGVLIGSFAEAHGYAEELMGCPIWTHEFADRELCDEIKAKAKQDFISIPVEK